jgi:hypothetical protein
VDGLWIGDFSILSAKWAKVAKLLFDDSDNVSFLVPTDAFGAEGVEVAAVYQADEL